jgi:hypothetical protein
VVAPPPSPTGTSSRELATGPPKQAIPEAGSTGSQILRLTPEQKALPQIEPTPLSVCPLV